MRILIVIIIAIAAAASCSRHEEPRVEVRGTLHAVMEGDVRSRVRLDTLISRGNIYALGAAENLDGEIIIWNSRGFISFVRNDSLQNRAIDSDGAAMLVFSRVAVWDTMLVNDPVRNLRELEVKIRCLLEATNRTEPAVFLIRGVAKDIQGHVVTPNAVGSHDHDRSSFRISLKDRDVEILGFYSTRHKAIFTHHDADSHLHVRDVNEGTVGHVDELLLTGPFRLMLSRR